MRCLLCNKELTDIIANRLRNGQQANVYYCKRCRLGALENKGTRKDLKAFYKNDYRKIFTPKIGKPASAEELFETYNPFQQQRINLIRRHLKKDMKLLEIGCSAGMFLKQAKKYVKEIVGIDYDTKSAKYAAKKCSCRVYDTELQNSGLPLKEFDIICILQSLEHMNDPHNFLNGIKPYLKPKGLIYLEVPNLFDALLYVYKLPGHKQFYFHSAHRWYFTQRSLNLLMKRAGFLGKIYYSQDYNILNHMHWLSFDSRQQSCVKGLSSPVLPLRSSLSRIKRLRLNKFIVDMDSKYKSLLAELGITSNISYIGRLR